MGIEEKIKPDDFDKELEQLMTDNGEKKGRKKRGGKKKKVVIAVAALAVLGIFAASKVMGSGKPKTPMVGTTAPVRKTIQNTLTVSGPVSGTDSVDVVSNLHAEVLEIPIKEGDKVQKDQVIAVLDDTDIKKEVEIAKNDYDLAISTCSEKTGKQETVMKKRCRIIRRQRRIMTEPRSCLTEAACRRSIWKLRRIQ